jgi:hypothetical protein
MSHTIYLVSIFHVYKAAGNDEWRAGAFRKPLLMAALFDSPTAKVVAEDLCSPEPVAKLVGGPRPASDPSASPPPPAGRASLFASLPETAAQQAIGLRRPNHLPRMHAARSSVQARHLIVTGSSRSVAGREATRRPADQLRQKDLVAGQ